MATVVADADVEILADVSKLAADLRRKIEPILKKINGNIDIVADTSEFTGEVKEAVKAAEKDKAEIKVDADTSAATRAVSATQARINRQRATIHVEVKVDEDTDKTSGSFLKRFAKLGSDAGTRFVKFLSDSLSTGFTNLQELGGKLSSSVAQGLIGLAAAGAVIAIGFPAAAGAIVLVANAIALLLPLTVALAGPLVALGAIAGVLFLAFKGFSSAIAGDEDALKKLGPEAQSVAKVLGGFKPVLQEIQKSGREALLTGLADPLQRLGDTVLPLAKTAIEGIATTINGVLRQAIDFFTGEEGNRQLVAFFDDLRQVVEELAKSAPAAGKALLDLLTVGTRLSTKVLPEIISGVIDLANRFSNFAQNGGLEQAFERGVVFARQLIDASRVILDIITKVGQAFLQGFTALIPTEDGQSRMDQFISSLEKLQKFLENPLVQQGISGIGTALFLLIAALGLAALAVGLLIGALVSLGKALPDILQQIIDFTEQAKQKWREWGIDLGGTVQNVVTTIQNFPNQVVTALSGLPNTVGSLMRSAFEAGTNAIRSELRNAIATVASFPASITGVFLRLPSQLYSAGASMIHAFVQGMLSQLKAALSAASSIVAGVKAFFPHSPAKTGPLSGSGYVDSSGEALVRDFAGGMLAKSKELQAASSTITAIVQDELGRRLASSLGATQQFQVPSFGNGGTVTAPTLAMVGEKGPERITPLGGGGSTTINNTRNVAPIINVNGMGASDDTASRVIARLLATGV